MKRSSNSSAPKNITWWIALILVVLGIIGKFASVQFLSQYAFWFVLASAVLLLIATRFRNL